jgi:membrane carboxypeptidase/penicillin-binding protein
MVHASQLINYINGLQVRDARLFCEKCKNKFNAMSTTMRSEFLRKRFEEHYGDKQFIYSLNDPNTNERRYVGRTSDPQRRLSRHIQKARQWNSELTPEHIDRVKDASTDFVSNLDTLHSSKKWIASLLESAEKPVLEILETVNPTVRVSEREMRWISQSIKEGYDLLNSENSSTELKNLIRQQNIDSFLTVSLDELIKSKFPSKVERLLRGRDTGWRRAALIQGIYKSEQKQIATGIGGQWSDFE